MNIPKQLSKIPKGYSEVEYQDKKYGLSRTYFNNGKSTKVYAEELGGNNYISFNYYHTQKGGLLKTCEMPEEKVQMFLAEMIPVQ